MKDWGLTIGARIKSRRDEVQMPVATLARAVGLASSTVYDLMRSDSVSTTKLHLFAKVLGLNVDWLETGRGPRLMSDAPRGAINETGSSYQLPLTLQEVEIGRNWGRLQEPQRTVVATQIRLLLLAQKRAESKPKRRSGADRSPPAQ